MTPTIKLISINVKTSEMKILLLIVLNLSVLTVSSQPSDSIEVIMGLEKYKKEVMDIRKSYSKTLDSLQNDRMDKMSKDSLYSQNELKNRPKKYWGYDGGIIGYTMNEETQKIKNMINKFLKIDRITSSSTKTNISGQTEYGFNYLRTKKGTDGKKIQIEGIVIWVDD